MKRVRFSNWCSEDINDTRRINYTVIINEAEYKFTSDDDLLELKIPVSLRWLNDTAILKSIRLTNNEWYVVLTK